MGRTVTIIIVCLIVLRVTTQDKMCENETISDTRTRGIMGKQISGNLSEVYDNQRNDKTLGHANRINGLLDEQVTRLRQDLLERSDKNIIPVDKNHKNKTSIYLSLYLKTLNNFDELGGHMESSVVMETHWYDYRLSWNNSEYQGFNRPVTFCFSEIWIPHILLWNPVYQFRIIDASDEFLKASAYSSGRTFYVIGRQLTSNCVPNVKYFPFDKHICYIDVIVYESLYSDKLSVQIGQVNRKFMFTDNHHWTVYEQKPELVHVNDNLTIARFTFLLERKPLFDIINFIFPILLLSLINGFVFAIPVEAGERTLFAVTIFLTLTVFMKIVSDIIPHSSNPMPIWCYFLLFKLIYSTCILLTSIMVIRMSSKQTEVPQCVQRLVKVWCRIARITWFGSNKTEVMLEEMPLKSTCLQEDDETYEFENGLSPRSWKSVAYVLDKLFLVTFLIIAILEIILTFVLTM